MDYRYSTAIEFGYYENNDSFNNVLKEIRLSLDDNKG